jgi:glutamate 5-kinase
MGDDVGTSFAPLKHKSTSKRLWIGFASNPRGSLIVDDGAKKAVLGGKASLLAAGVMGASGEFSAGDPVFIADQNGKRLAKGLVGFDSEEIPQLVGKSTTQLEKEFGSEFGHPLVHRDDLVLL